MKSRAFALAFALTLLILSATHPYSVAVHAAGNPWPPQPNTTPPTLTVQTLRNTTIFMDSTIHVTFTVVTPGMWKTTGDNGVPLGEVIGVQIFLDQNLTAEYPGFRGGGITKRYSRVEENVIDGPHTLTISVLSNSYYNPIFPHFHGDVASYQIIVKETFLITVGNDASPSAFPTPSLSAVYSPSQTPMQTDYTVYDLNMPQNPSPSIPEFPIGIIALVFIAATIVAAFFKKNHGKTNRGKNI